MANIYKSSYTGAQVDSAIEKSLSIEANPSTTGTATLTKLKVGSMVYNVPQGSTSGGGDTTYRGTAITGTSTTATAFSNSGITAAKVGDWYINTNNGNVYQCTVAGNAATAKWVYKCTQAVLTNTSIDEPLHMGIGSWGDDTSGYGAFLTQDSANGTGYLDLINGANYLCRISPDNVTMGNHTYYLPDNDSNKETNTLALANVISVTITAWPTDGNEVQIGTLTTDNIGGLNFQHTILKIGTSDTIYRYFYPGYDNNQNSYTFVSGDGKYKVIPTNTKTAPGPAKLTLNNTFDYPIHAQNNFNTSTIEPTYVEVKQVGDGTGNYTSVISYNKLTYSGIEHKSGDNTLTLKIPNRNGTETIATLEESQTFTGSNNFNGATFTGEVDIKENKPLVIGQFGIDPGQTAPFALFYNSYIMVKANGETGGDKIRTLTFPTTKSGTFALTSDIPTVIANPTADGTTALTKLKVGDTIYTLPTSGSGSGDVTAAGDNIFTGINTFEPTKLKVGGANSYYTFHIDNGSLNWSGIVGDSYRFPNVSLYVPTVPDTTANASQKTFHYQLPCKKEAAGSPVNIVTENEDNTFTGNNSFTNPITTTNANGFIIAPTNTNNYKASIWVDTGTLADEAISLEMSVSGTIVTREADQEFTGDNTFSGINTCNGEMKFGSSSLKIQNVEKAVGGNGIMATTIKGWSATGGGNNDFTLTLPKANGTIATQEWVTALFSYANNTLTINI